MFRRREMETRHNWPGDSRWELEDLFEKKNEKLAIRRAKKLNPRLFVQWNEAYPSHEAYPSDRNWLLG